MIIQNNIIHIDIDDFRKKIEYFLEYETKNDENNVINELFLFKDIF